MRNPYRLFKNEQFDLPSDVTIDCSFDAVRKRERFVYKFDGQEEIVEFNVYTKEELKKMFKKAGLEITHVYGGFDESNYTEYSERLILVAKK